MSILDHDDDAVARALQAVSRDVDEVRGRLLEMADPVVPASKLSADT